MWVGDTQMRSFESDHALQRHHDSQIVTVDFGITSNMTGQFSICNANPIWEQTIQEYWEKPLKWSKMNLPHVTLLIFLNRFARISRMTTAAPQLMEFHVRQNLSLSHKNTHTHTCLHITPDAYTHTHTHTKYTHIYHTCLHGHASTLSLSLSHTHTHTYTHTHTHTYTHTTLYITVSPSQMAPPSIWNTSNRNTTPALSHLEHTTAMKTPNFYVQQPFATHEPCQNLSSFHLIKAHQSREKTITPWLQQTLQAAAYCRIFNMHRKHTCHFFFYHSDGVPSYSADLHII